MRFAYSMFMYLYVLMCKHVYKAKKSCCSTGSEPDGDDTFSLCDTAAAFLDQFRGQVGLFICCALCAYSPNPTLAHAIL